MAVLPPPPPLERASILLFILSRKVEMLSILETLAQESYDIISLLPTYIEHTRNAVYNVGNDTRTMFKDVESIMTEEEDIGGKKSLRKAIVATEQHILDASKELKDIIVESGSMAESLFERVDNGYKELEEIKGLSNVEKVLLDTADSV